MRTSAPDGSPATPGAGSRAPMLGPPKRPTDSHLPSGTLVTGRSRATTTADHRSPLLPVVRGSSCARGLGAAAPARPRSPVSKPQAAGPRPPSGAITRARQHPGQGRQPPSRLGGPHHGRHQEGLPRRRRDRQGDLAQGRRRGGPRPTRSGTSATTSARTSATPATTSARPAATPAARSRTSPRAPDRRATRSSPRPRRPCNARVSLRPGFRRSASPQRARRLVAAISNPSRSRL